MATNGKAKKESTAVTTTTKKAPSIKSGTQDVAAVAQHGATLLQNMHKDIVTNEAQQDAGIDATEDRVLDTLMKELENDSVPFDKRQEVRNQCFERLDRRRASASKAKKENTKRWGYVVCGIVICILGIAGLKYVAASPRPMQQSV